MLRLQSLLWMCVCMWIQGFSDRTRPVEEQARKIKSVFQSRNEVTCKDQAQLFFHIWVLGYGLVYDTVNFLTFMK